MRFSIYSLRIGILANLALLIISAMLLINVVMVKFAERDLLRYKVRLGNTLLNALIQKVGNRITDNHDSWLDLVSRSTFQIEINTLLKAGGFSSVLFVNNQEGVVADENMSEKNKTEALSLAIRSLTTREWLLEYFGSTWGVIWLAPENMKMSAPLIIDRHPVGSITICSHLTETYQVLRKSEKIVLIYVFLNTVILILVGIYLLSRTVVNPIHKILKTTEAFREGEALNLMTETSQNEIGQLSRSLNSMLKRLEENKEELKSHISSLESANQEIKEAQEKIIRSEKLASVGRLASGVAHEIGNPIGIILGYIELVKKGDLTDDEVQDSLNRVESELTRVSRIIRQLLDFSRPSGGEQKETKVHELVIETVNMLNPQPMMSNIKAETHLNAANDSVWADPSQLQQVILNIIMNSADAMGEFRDSASQELENVLTIVSNNRGDILELKFSDTGPGIPEEELTHIFDPFYTTKDPGKGTGLGLSVCNAIMEGLGGSISAESVLAKGTTIIMSIPLFRSQNSSNMAQDRGTSL